MIVEISVFIAAAAFAVLVFYVIRTLLTAQQSLERVSSTLATLEQTVVGMKADLQSAVKHTNEMTANVQQQLHKITPLMNSIENAGQALEEVTSAAKQVSVGFMKGVRKSAARNRQKRATADTSRFLPPVYQAESESPQDVHTYKVRTPHSSSENWKTWIDLGTKIWKMYRSQ